MPIDYTQGKPPRRHVLGAMFDVRPTKPSGGLDLDKATRPQAKLNLRAPSTAPVAKIQPQPSEFFSDNATLASATSKRAMPLVSTQHSKTHQPTVQPMAVTESESLSPIEPHKDHVLKELEAIVSSPLNVTAEVAKFGGRLHFHTSRPQAPQSVEQFPDWLVDNPQPTVQTMTVSELELESNDSLTNWWTKVSKAKEDRLLKLSEVSVSSDVERSEDELQAVTTATRRPWPASTGSNYQTSDRLRNKNLLKPRPDLRRKWRFKIPRLVTGRRACVAGMVIAVLFVGFKFLVQSETSIKSNVVQNGKNAVANLLDAREKLTGLEFAAAANDFALAHDDFSKAGSRLDRIGAVFAPVVRYIPGLNKIAAANNLVVAGQQISQAGFDLATALDGLTQLQLSSFFNPDKGQSRQSLYELFHSLRDTITASQNKVNTASRLLASVNESILPDDKREEFGLFKDKLPELTDFFDKANAYLDTLVALIGDKGTKTYLVLLQNNSELRATGGFPGSYALLSFRDGYLQSVKIDDSYNPDGQLHGNVIPPKPLQHITPTWGMRDANWFADFPTSAQKVMDFYGKSTGTVVDGVLALTPDVITDILSVTGPIEMPDYGLTLGVDNFLSQIQEQVEYGQDKEDGRPKKILADFQPKFLEKLVQQDKDHLMQISQKLSTAFEQKRIMAYFVNNNAEKVAIAKGFAGELKTPAADYLQINISNVKGFKTDLVTKTAIKLQTTLGSDGVAEHELAITRTHTGGKSAQKFYNQPNPAYIRVYAPLGAQFESIQGNTWASYDPLVDYSNSVYKTDSDLAAIEASTRNPVFGVDVFQESGKTVFGFWLVVDPGKSKTVTLKYKVPHAYSNNEYDFYVQKQSGTIGISFDADFQFSEGTSLFGFLPGDLKTIQNTAHLSTSLDLDIPIELQTK